MKRSLLSAIALLLCISVTQRSYAQAGMLDATYGTGGKANSLIGTTGGQVWSMCSQDGWSIVLGGFALSGADSAFALSRFTRDGRLDSTFGTNGSVISPVRNRADVIYATGYQPDGHIIAGGISYSGTHFEFAVGRYTNAGTIDNTFGDGGKAHTTIGHGDAIGTAMCIQDGWSIVLGGIIDNGFNKDFALIRYTRYGVIDSTFGTNGIVITDLGGDDAIAALAVLPDSSIVAVGTSSGLADHHFAVAKYRENGTLDNTFGSGGITVVNGTGDDIASAMTIQPDGKIVAGGYSTNGVNDDFGLVRFMPDGTLDNSFGNNGQVITSIGNSDESIYSITMQADGSIIGAGSSQDSSNISRNALARYRTNGSPDSTFGTHGRVTTAMSTGNNEIYAVTIENDGKILTAGYANDGTHDLFSMARYISDLHLGLIDLSVKNSMLIYPNPVSESTTLEYTLDRDELVSIQLYDTEGRLVQTISKDQRQTAGDHKQSLHIADALASGSYILQIASPSGQMSIKVTK